MQDEVPGRAGDGQDVGQRHLAGLVDEQRVDAALELLARPEPGRSGGYVQVAVPQAVLQRAMLQAGGVRMQVRVVLASALADARADDAQLVGACGDLAEQVVDDGVGGAGDADRAPGLDELEDLPGGGEGLPGPGWSLDRQVGAAEGEDEPDRRVGHRFAVAAQRPSRTAPVIRPQAQQERSPGIPSGHALPQRPGRRGHGAAPPALWC